MKILYLSKRFYTNKDLLAEQYGRVFEFSRVLAQRGHSVDGYALDYRRTMQADVAECSEPGLNWHSVSLFPGPLGRFRQYIKMLQLAIRNQRPDALVSVSDVYHVLLGDWLARKYSVPHFADLYDNYESFSAARIPGVISRYRKSLRRADGISCVSASLKDYLHEHVRPVREPRVIINAVDKSNFYPMDMQSCRARFGIASDSQVIGLGGGISMFRGVDVVFKAHRSLLDSGREVHLVLAGVRAGNIVIPESPYIHYLGKLDYAEMPYFYNALDVGIVTNTDNPFSRYCFPQKFFEMCACKRPVVVADVGDVREYIGPCEQGLFRPGDSEALTRAFAAQLDAPCLVGGHVPDWNEQAMQFVDFLESS